MLHCTHKYVQLLLFCILRNFDMKLKVCGIKLGFLNVNENINSEPALIHHYQSPYFIQKLTTGICSMFFSPPKNLLS